MRIYSELDLNTFEAWSGAVNTLDRIRREGKCEELEGILEESYPEGIDEADLEDDLKALDEDYNADCEDVSEIERERIWIESYKDDHNSLINDIAEIKENIAELEEELKEV